jgi:predicted site-specific integrase-resolvase
MPQSENLLGTKEFARKAGVSASTISKWLRSGKLKGIKQNGKWMIADAELNTIEAAKSDKSGQATVTKTRAAAAKPHKSAGKSFSIEKFSAMTYLTEFGVKKWIKEGKISTTRDASGQPLIDAANLDNTNIKRLIRN